MPRQKFLSGHVFAWKKPFDNRYFGKMPLDIHCGIRYSNGVDRPQYCRTGAKEVMPMSNERKGITAGMAR